MHDHLYNVPVNARRICFGYGFSGLDWQVSSRLYELEMAGALSHWRRQHHLERQDRGRPWIDRLATAMVRMGRAIRAWRQRRITCRSLMVLDSRLLKDIGVYRGMIPGVAALDEH